MEITPEVQELLDKQKAELTAQFQESEAGLKKSRDDLLAEKKEASEKARIAAEEAANAKLEQDRKSKNIEAIEASWAEKYNAKDKQLNDLMGQIKNGKKNELANKFVSSNVVDDPFSRDAMAREYAARIDFEGDKVRVLDIDGNPTALSVSDLDNEFKTAGKYANHIKAANSSGLGASSNIGSTGGAAPTSLREAQRARRQAKFGN